MSGGGAAPAVVLAAANAALAELGLEGASVEAAGHDGAVALVTLAAGAPDLVQNALGAEVSRRLKALGFRYVAVNLAAAG